MDTICTFGANYMNLVIDIGNSLTKLAVFSDDKIVFNNNYESLTVNDVTSLLKQFNIVNSIISNVRDNKIDLENVLSKKTTFISLSQLTLLPFNNLYTTPSTLGKDRIALVAAASSLYPNLNVLVIDAGTCITYDFIDKENNYVGGAISPGLNLRLKALNQFTGKLPLVQINIEEKPKLIGKSTIDSIKSGVYFGVKTEIEGIISNYISLYDNFQIVFTGGSAEMFDLEAKNRIFADKFFLMKGLNEILKYNAKN